MESEQALLKRLGKNCEEGRCREILPKDWGLGPWETEPNRVDFRMFGFPCFVHRAPATGNWCGYVGVPRSHPAFGHHYDDLRVRVHGGLTYSGKSHGHLRHGPRGALWVLGFDCAHAGDFIPRIEATLREVRDLPLPGFTPMLKARREGNGVRGAWMDPESVTHEDDGTIVFHEHYWTAEEVIAETNPQAGY